MSDFTDKEAKTGTICPACSGHCQVLEETPLGTYRAALCRLCDGEGVVDLVKAKAYKDTQRQAGG